MAALARAFGPVFDADMRQLPVATHTIDPVLAAASLLHLPPHAATQALTEFHRVLTPGGRLVLSVKAGDGDYVEDAGRFFHLYTSAELDGALLEAGFTVTARVGDPDLAHPGSSWHIRAAHT